MLRQSIRKVPIVILAVLALGACSDNAIDPGPEDPSSQVEPTATEPSSQAPSQEPSATTEEPEPSQSATTEDAQGPDADGQGQGADGPTGEVSDFISPPITSEDYPQYGENTGDVLLQDIRFGSHDGYERVVLEFSGSGELGYFANYVEEAVEDGSGFPIDVSAAAVLDIHVSGVMTPISDDGELLEFLNDPQTPPAGSIIAEVIPRAPFEGMSQYVIGLDQERDVRAYLLQEPLRLVIDIAN